MKRILLAVLTALTLAPAARAADAEVGVGAQVALPVGGGYDLLDNGMGLDFSFRRWCSLPVGYQVSAGFTSWDAGDGSKVGSNLDDFSGDALTVPFGISALYQLTEWPVTLELGVRYVLVDSNITAVNTDAKEELDVDVDNGVVGVAAVQTDWEISKSCLLGVDFGTQFDLAQGDVKTDLGPAVDSELAGFFLRVALRFPL